MTTLVTLLCAFVALAAAPLGLLPSVLFFRDVANGTDTSEPRKRAYEWTVWLGLSAAWLAATCGLAFAVCLLF